MVKLNNRRSGVYFWPPPFMSESKSWHSLPGNVLGIKSGCESPRQINEAGRACRSARAVRKATDSQIFHDGAHGVTRPTFYHFNSCNRRATSSALARLLNALMRK